MVVPAPSAQNRAVVTGASSGIGAALADTLAARGYAVQLVARREDLLAELAERITRRHGVKAEVRPCDLADPEQRAKLCAELAELEVSVLGNNAGFTTMGPVATLDPEQERRQVAVNVDAVHDLTLAVLPGMVRRRAGGILITGSVGGNQPSGFNSTYAASKGFDNLFAESLHSELRGTGVNVTLLAPGPSRTDIFENAGIWRIGRLPNFLLTTPDYVAEQGVRGLVAGKRRVSPGLLNKILGVGLYSPRAIQLPLVTAVYRRVSR